MEVARASERELARREPERMQEQAPPALGPSRSAAPGPGAARTAALAALTISALTHERMHRRAAQEATHRAEKRERKLTIDLAVVNDEIASLRGEQTELKLGHAPGQEPELELQSQPQSQPVRRAGHRQLRPSWCETLDVVQTEGSPSPSAGRRKVVSVVQPQTGHSSTQMDGAARLTRHLSSTLCIQPHPSRTASVHSPGKAGGESNNEATCQPLRQQHAEDNHEMHSTEYDFHFPEVQSSTSRRANANPEEVKLAATMLEADALRKQLNQALGTEWSFGETAGPEVVGSPLFEAFIVVGGGVALADEIKTACKWWKPSKAEEEYNLLAARTQAELLCIYPPSANAGRSSMLQAFAMPDIAVRRFVSRVWRDNPVDCSTVSACTSREVHLLISFAPIRVTLRHLNSKLWRSYRRYHQSSTMYFR